MHRRGRARQLVSAVVVVLAAGCTTPSPMSRPASSESGRGDVASGSPPPHQRGREAAASSAVAVDSTPQRLLRQWDARRAAAYAEGSVAELRRLYTPGSGAGEADVAMLREYVGRDVRVVGMEMQILRMKVLDHRPGEWRLRVTDRLHHAVAVSEEGRVRLPRDQATTHELRLVLEGRWRVAEVRPVRDGG